MYLGLDLSLRKTGVATYDPLTGVHDMETISVSDKLRGPHRLDYLSKRLAEVLARHEYQGVAIEGYAMGTKGGRAFDIGEWGGIARLMVYREGIPTILVPPSVLKKYLTGNGVSDKNLILLAVYKRYGIEAEDDNQADAIGLADMTYHVHSRKVPAFEYQVDALTKVQKMIVGVPKNRISRVRHRVRSKI